MVARLDDREEQAALAIDKSKADDETTIVAQQKIADEKEIAAKRMKTSGAGGAVGELELMDALLQADVEKAKVELSRTQHEQDVLKYKQTQIAVEKLKLYSPIDGIVAQRLLEKGESADGGNMKALVVVQVNPLRIDVPVPIMEAAKLPIGTEAEVNFADKAAKGKVTRSSPVGDAASGTVIVRVEVENPENRKTGEKVSVSFPSAVAAK
jgi:multidrug efflux pump subunit AcrA (membrane-fusion protein)